MTEFDRLLLPIQSRLLIHEYSDADQCTATLHCVKLEEALADKLKCLIQRRYCNDLFDFVYAVFIADVLEVDRAELIRVFLRKTIFGPSPETAKQILLNLPFELIQGYWKHVVSPLASRISFEGATAALRAGLQPLFAPFGFGENMAWAFFPPELRNPILEAGAERRLLRVRYGGISRLMEPYALSFKRRKDGLAREYLYVHDFTGGHSGPGIKSLVHTAIQDLEITDDTFTPRYPVELAKSGEPPRLGYFPGARGPTLWFSGFRRQARRRSRRR